MAMLQSQLKKGNDSDDEEEEEDDGKTKTLKNEKCKKKRT